MTDTELQQKRLIAAAIDAGIAIGLAIVLQIVTVVAGFLNYWLAVLMGVVTQAAVLGYILARDVTGGDRSFGKKIQNIRVQLTSGGPVTLMDSVKRNAILSIGSVLCLLYAVVRVVPVLGCLASPLVILGSIIGLVAVIIEVIKILQDPAGVRIGDQMANTRVVR